MARVLITGMSAAGKSTLLARVAIRSNNPYGKSAAQRAEIAGYVETVEPPLRRTATIELDGRRPTTDLADEVARLLDGPTQRRRGS